MEQPHRMATRANSVSVVIPTYNGARYVADQVFSIAAQLSADDELVCVDDCSSDETTEILEWVCGDVAMSVGCAARVIHHPRNRGVNATVDTGLQAASRRFIFLSDQDDLWMPGKLAVQIDELSRTKDSSLCVSDVALADADGVPTGHTMFDELKVSRSEIDQYRLSPLPALVRRSVFPGMSFAFHRRLLPHISPIPLGVPHDYWIALIAGSMGSIAVAERPTVIYRQHGANQVGLSHRTLRYRALRVLHAEYPNYSTSALFEHLRQRSSFIDEHNSSLIDGKIAFESARAAVHASRRRKVSTIIGLLRSGGYRRFASNGDLNAVRDLLAPLASASLEGRVRA